MSDRDWTNFLGLNASWLIAGAGVGAWWYYRRNQRNQLVEMLMADPRTSGLNAENVASEYIGILGFNSAQAAFDQILLLLPPPEMRPPLEAVVADGAEAVKTAAEKMAPPTPPSQPTTMERPEPEPETVVEKVREAVAETIFPSADPTYAGLSMGSWHEPDYMQEGNN